MAIVRSEQFNPMKGHVCQNNVIVFPDNSELIIKSNMKGWLLRENGKTVAGPFDSAYGLTLEIIAQEKKRGR